MFKVVKRTEPYLYPVTLEFIEDDGNRTKATFRGRFKRLPSEEVIETTKAIFAQTISDKEVVRKVLVGWEHILDENGQPLEFNEENLSARLEEHGFARDVVISWLESIGKAKTKN